MTRSILRIMLTTLALIMLFAGSFNLNRSRAQVQFEYGDEGGGGGDCGRYCGCMGGPQICCVIHYPGGPQVNCGMAS